MKTLMYLPRLLYIILLISVFLLGVYHFNYLKKGITELSLIIHPPNVKVISSEQFSAHLRLDSAKDKDTLLQFYNIELKRNGWSYVNESEAPEYETQSKKTMMTGNYIQNVFYEKDNLELCLTWIRDSSGVYKKSFTITIVPKQSR